MATVLHIITAVLLFVGCLTAVSAAVGVLRFPDFFTRLHASGKSDTLAQGAILFGLMIAAFALGKPGIALKLLLISAFLGVTTPSATYAIAHAAQADGREPWTRPPGTEVTIDVPKPDEV